MSTKTRISRKKIRKILLTLIILAIIIFFSVQIVRTKLQLNEVRRLLRENKISEAEMTLAEALNSMALKFLSEKELDQNFESIKAKKILRDLDQYELQRQEELIITISPLCFPEVIEEARQRDLALQIELGKQNTLEAMLTIENFVERRKALELYLAAESIKPESARSKFYFKAKREADRIKQERANALDAANKLANNGQFDACIPYYQTALLYGAPVKQTLETLLNANNIVREVLYKVERLTKKTKWNEALELLNDAPKEVQAQFKKVRQKIGSICKQNAQREWIQILKMRFNKKFSKPDVKGSKGSREAYYRQRRHNLTQALHFYQLAEKAGLPCKANVSRMASFLLNSAMARLRAGDQDGAREAFVMSEQAGAPKHPAMQKMRGSDCLKEIRLLLTKEKFADAEAKLAQADKLGAGSLKTFKFLKALTNEKKHLALGKSLREQGKLEESLAAFQKALATSRVPKSVQKEIETVKNMMKRKKSQK